MNRYLQETPLGNIVRGWDVDSKPIQTRNRIEEKERVFSLSSYANWMGSQNSNAMDFVNGPSQPLKKKRKTTSYSKFETEDF